MSESNGRRRIATGTALALPVLFLLMLVEAAPAKGCDPVAVALGKTSAASCPGLDANGDGRVDSAELQRSVAGVQSGNSRAPRDAGTVTIDVGTVTGSPGAQVTFGVSLDGGGLTVTGTQNDIAFDPLTPITGCTAEPGTGKDAITGYQPFPCTFGVDCTAIRVLILSLSNVDPIPDGPLYSCDVDIHPAAPAGTYPLISSNEGAAGGLPDIPALPTVGDDGAVIVSSLDNFKCYKASDLKQPKFESATVSLGDQFETQDAEVKKPYLVCNPASVDGAAIAHPTEHLVCYKIKSPKLAAEPKVAIGNQLGTVHLQAKKPFLACMRSTKQLLP